MSLCSIWTRWSCSSSYRVIFVTRPPSHQICDACHPKSSSFISVGHPLLSSGHQTLVCMSRQTAMFPFAATRIPLIYTVELSADRPSTRRFAVRGITPGSTIVRETLTALRHFPRDACAPCHAFTVLTMTLVYLGGRRLGGSRLQVHTDATMSSRVEILRYRE